MIYIKKIERVFFSQPTEVIPKLYRYTETVNNPYFASSVRLRVDPAVPFQGAINEIEKKFSLKRLRPVTQFLLPILVVRGKVYSKEQQTILQIKFQLGFYPSIILLYILIGLGLTIQNCIQYGFGIHNVLIWVLIILIYTSLTAYEVSLTKEKLYEML